MKRPMRTYATRLLLLTVLLFVAGCSSYQKKWQNPPLASGGKDLLEGSYEGRWESSQYKGASGRLWCVLTRRSADSYEADFRATWHGIFSSRHQVILKTKPAKRVDGKRVTPFEGAMEIRMWIGSGHYHCIGTMTPQDFRAEYDAEYDRGVFTLTRAAHSKP